MTFSNFAITGYINTKTPPELAGSIASFLYWHEGLSDWAILGDTPPTLPKGTALDLAVQWANLSSERISGHIDLTVTKPDGSKVTPCDVLNQDRWSTPQNAWAVQFEPITLDQSGTYQAVAKLSTMGEVLDEKAVAFATVPAVARFYMPPVLDFWIDHVEIVGYHYHRITFGVTVTNQGDAPGTHNLEWHKFYDSTEIGHGERATITLQPGESYQLKDWVDIDFSRCSNATFTVSGDWQGNNYSEGYLVEGDVITGNLIEEKHSDW